MSDLNPTNTIYGNAAGMLIPGALLVDKTFTPDSDNPQSGRAIAAALLPYVNLQDNIEWVFDGGDSSRAVTSEIITTDKVAIGSEALVTSDAVASYVTEEVNKIASAFNEFKDEAVTKFDSLNSTITNNTQYAVETRECLEGRTTDFILMQGEVGNWAYRQWSSGILECWFDGYVDFKDEDCASTGIYNIYVASVNLTIPFNFIEPPVSFASCQWHYTDWVDAQVTFDTEQNNVVTVRKFGNTNSFKIRRHRINIYVKGRYCINEST